MIAVVSERAEPCEAPQGVHREESVRSGPRAPGKYPHRVAFRARRGILGVPVVRRLGIRIARIPRLATARSGITNPLGMDAHELGRNHARFSSPSDSIPDARYHSCSSSPPAMASRQDHPMRLQPSPCSGPVPCIVSRGDPRVHRSRFRSPRRAGRRPSRATCSRDQSASSGNVTQARGKTRDIDFTTSEGTWMSGRPLPRPHMDRLRPAWANIYRCRRPGGEATALTQYSGVALNFQPRISPDWKAHRVHQRPARPVQSRG
jgi:hypothetical protein